MYSLAPLRLPIGNQKLTYNSVSGPVEIVTLKGFVKALIEKYQDLMCDMAFEIDVLDAKRSHTGRVQHFRLDSVPVSFGAMEDDKILAEDASISVETIALKEVSQDFELQVAEWIKKEITMPEDQKHDKQFEGYAAESNKIDNQCIEEAIEAVTIASMENFIEPTHVFYMSKDGKDILVSAGLDNIKLLLENVNGTLMFGIMVEKRHALRGVEFNMK